MLQEERVQVERKTNDKGKTRAENKDKESHFFMAMFEDGEDAGKDAAET